MKWLSPSLYLLGALLTFAPVSLRVMSWQGGIAHHESAVDVQVGKELFLHEWTVNDPLAGGDGLGPVYNATSCAACHQQGGIGGGGGLKHNVTAFVSASVGRGGARASNSGVLHAFAVAPEFQETLNLLDSNLPAVSQPSLEELNAAVGRASTSLQVSQRNTTALFGANLIDAIADRVILAHEKQQSLKANFASGASKEIPVGRTHRLGNGKVGKFGWKAQAPSLVEFVQAACANELGLGNPNQAQPTPIGKRDYLATALDLTNKQCDQMTAYVASLPRPMEVVPDDPRVRKEAAHGKHLFSAIGCAECHTPNLGSVDGLYSDLLLHRMGDDLQGSGSYYVPPDLPIASSGGPLRDEWRTPPLWGVADSAPYLHDGRAKTLDEAIMLHGGQGRFSAQSFARLSAADRQALLAFLHTLRAP